MAKKEEQEFDFEDLDEVSREVLRDVWRAEASQLGAEAAKAEAEAEKAKAEARKAIAEAKLSELELKSTRISVTREEASEKERLAKDEENLTFVFATGVTDSSVRACMSKLSQWHRMYPGKDFTIIINSEGGDVIDGMALFDHIIWLRDNGHEVNMVVRGMAASMGGILLQSASKRVVGKEAWVLVHRAAFLAMGKTFQVEDEVKWVKRVEDRIIDIFVARAKEACENGTAERAVTRQMIKKNWDRKDWWLTSEECVQLGIADEVG